MGQSCRKGYLRELPVGGVGAAAHGAAVHLVGEAELTVGGVEGQAAAAVPNDLEVGALVAGQVGAGRLRLARVEVAGQHPLVSEVVDGAPGRGGTRAAPGGAGREAAGVDGGGCRGEGKNKLRELHGDGTWGLRRRSCGRDLDSKEFGKRGVKGLRVMVF